MNYKGLSLEQMLEQEEFLQLPLSKWYEMMKNKDGVCYEFTLSTILIALIKYYDKSINVNSFYYKDNQEWLDRNTRLGLQNLINSGADNITIQLKDSIVDIKATKLKEFLNQLEIYAGKCFAVTAEHLQNMKQLNTTEELLNYDYTAKYPNKIILNENQH